MPSLAEPCAPISMPSQKRSTRYLRRLRNWTSLAVIGFVLLSLQACIRPQVVLDQTIPHRVAEPTAILVWANDGAGKLVKVLTRIDDSWYIASSRILE